jgi:uncharacterized protein (TIGR03067 family)
VTQQTAMRIVVVLVLGFVAAFLVGVPASAAPVPKHLMKEAENTEETKLQGRWKLESLGVGGIQPQGGVGQQVEMTLEFRGTKLTGTSEGRGMNATFKLDIVDGVKRLAITDTKAVDRMGQPVAEEDVTFGYCIIDGAKLTLAATIDGKRAVDPAKAGDNALVLVLTRIKEKN